MREFFGFGGYQRPAEGFLSWQHLLFVSCLVVLMVVFAVVLGRKNRNKDYEIKNRVLVWSAVLIDAFEIFKIVFMCLREHDPFRWRYELPLFLCSILLIAMPIAAFAKGRLREAAVDFVLIFGVLGAVLGTYCAGNNYAANPVLCFDNVISGVTHTLSGFASLYIGVAGMATMKKKNIPITFAVLLGFAGCAAVANKIVDYNYMFLRKGDGTPYDILYSLVNGNPVVYPLCVVGLLLVYILVFYGVHHLVKRYGNKRVKVTV